MNEMATIQDKYQNLPGVKVTYEDGNLFGGNLSTPARTQSMLLIGSAVDGPVGVPISVRQIGVKAAEKLFGGLIDRKTKKPLPASLIRGMYEALKAGNEDVRLIRIDGRAARTVLKAKDVARAMEQFLGYADGNVAFGVDLHVPDGGKFIGVTAVTEIDKVTGDTTSFSPLAVVDYTDETPGAEKTYFFPNKMRPGNQVKINYDYETRAYTLVPRSDTSGNPDYTDPDYTLTRDTVQTHYFFSSRVNWSDLKVSGHVPLVTVKDNVSGKIYTIPSTTPDGKYIYRVGKGWNVTDPLTDPWNYAEGGIFFTSAYDAEVAKGTYPNITGNVTVYCEYAWYTSFGQHGEATGTIPGMDVTYDLDYTPLVEDFEVYYVDSKGNKQNLSEGADYSLSLSDRKLTVKAGVAPVQAQLYANYKSASSMVADPELVVEGKYPGTVYGSLTDLYDKTSIRGVQVKVEVDPRDRTGMEKIITFIKPDEKKLSYKDTALVYKTMDLPRVQTLRDFVNYVNGDPMNNIVQLSCDNQFGQVLVKGLLPTEAKYLGEVEPGVLKEDPTYPQGTKERYPWLGDDGIFDTTNQADMQRLWDRLGGVYEIDEKGEPRLVQQGIYQMLENYVVDAIVLIDAYANTVIDPEDDTGNKNFATQLAQHCAIVTAKTWETIGFIGVAPAPNTDLVSLQSYIDELTAPGVNEHYMYDEATLDNVLNDEGDRIDIGRYVNVVFGPELGLNQEKLGNYVSSGVVTYAALVTTLNPEVAPTNKSMDSVLGLRYTLSEAQHDQLVGARYVTFDQKTFVGNGGATTRYVVKDSPTAALPSSDYQRLSTVRIVHAAVQLVRQKADPFIGLPNGLAQRNALTAEVQAGLDKMKENGVLQRFSFEIYSSVQDKVLGNAYIRLELVPQFETRKFLTSVVLRAS
jgi:hypothetical protein